MQISSATWTADSQCQQQEITSVKNPTIAVFGTESVLQRYISTPHLEAGYTGLRYYS